MSQSMTVARTPKEPDPARLQRERVERFRFWRQLVQEPKAVVGLVILGFFLFITIFAPVIATHNPTAILGTPWQPPSATYWFGTTDEGQDVFSQWVFGTRTTMVIGLGVGLIGTVISVLIGVYGGYKGGRVDAALNWLTNVMLALPSYPLILVIASYIPDAGSLAITLILGLTSWPAAARMKRAQALTFASRDFVLAAKLSGVSDLRIMATEIFPNMLSLVFNTFISMMSTGIFGEAFLRFLGIGSTNTPSWGNMLNWAQNAEALLNGGWWWFIPPGASITLVLLCLTLINYGIDTISNPRLAKPPRLPKGFKLPVQSVQGGESA